ncbi:hypothetical protein DL98DRAFT_635736 [Cadophora sp. DSE1049]|nr:hypothetical protein DL98DRAFT_635736 [Cadophora sp. DSE1049]
MPSELLPIEGVSTVGRLGRPDPRTTTLPAHKLQDLDYSRNIRLCVRQSRKCRLPVSKGGIVLKGPTEGDVTKLLSILESPSTGRFVYGTTCLALARSDESVVPNRYHYALLALHYLRRFALEYELDQEHFDLMNAILEEAQKQCDFHWAEARERSTRNAQFHEVLDAMGKWRQGRYMLNLHDEEEPISPFSPHKDIAAGPISNQILSRSASQETLVGTNMANSVKGAESSKNSEEESQEDEIVSTESPSKNSGVLDQYEGLKLEDKGAQEIFVETGMANLVDVAESPKKTVDETQEVRPAVPRARRKALTY